MSLLETNIFDECIGSDQDLLDNAYYKLPFCDEDVKDLRNLPDSNNLWSSDFIKEEFVGYPFSSTSSGFCLSPSSTSTTSSGAHHSVDHLLINERPDTPLMAVKFEDFSSAYDFSDLSYANTMENSDETMEEVNIDDEITLDIKQETNTDTRRSSSSGSERTVDCSLAPSATLPPPPRVENVFRISKNEDGNTTAKPALLPCDIKTEGIRFSFSKDQPMIPCLSIPAGSTSIQTTTATDNSNSTQMYLCDQSTLIKASSVKTNPITTTDATVISSDVSATPVHRFKVVPQSKISSNNSFTHKTHIQIPTSTLQTILKNGRLVTRLQQQDGKIRIKTEPCSDMKQYVKITQPQQQVDLPPTPPSSASSDGEGSSSPKSNSSRSGDSPRFSATHIRVQPSGSTLAAQLLSSSQRFAQAHGPLILSEEEKRTLVAEGYPVPTKLPLSKTEEKSLKKIRRKIKNKLSAQESRRKKKEYVETLEKRMDDFNKENLDLKRKLDSLESSNRSLLSQLRSLQTLVAGKMPKPSRSVTTQTSSCLMMLVLCFAVFLGGWIPQLSPLSSSDINSVAYYQHQALEVASAGKVLFSFKEEEHCHGKLECRDWVGNPSQKYQEEKQPPDTGKSGSDTYAEPAGGRTTMNDTGDQTGKIIANTMEPKTAADVLASRKVVVKNSKIEVVVNGETPHDVTKKIVVSSQLVTE